MVRNQERKRWEGRNGMIAIFALDGEDCGFTGFEYPYERYGDGDEHGNGSGGGGGLPEFAGTCGNGFGFGSTYFGVVYGGEDPSTGPGDGSRSHVQFGNGEGGGKGEGDFE